MTVTKRTLEICKQALDYFEDNPNKNAFIKIREGNENYIDAMVLRDIFYYGSNSYTFWDGSIYGFSFDANLFEGEKEDEK